MAQKQTDTMYSYEPVQPRIKYDPRALRKIVGTALQQVPGVLGPAGGLLSNWTDPMTRETNLDVRRGASVSEEDGKVQVHARLIVQEGTDYGSLITRVVMAVTDALKQQTDLQVTRLDVMIVSAMSLEAYKSRFHSSRREDPATK